MHVMNNTLVISSYIYENRFWVLVCHLFAATVACVDIRELSSASLLLNGLFYKKFLHSWIDYSQNIIFDNQEEDYS